MKRLLLLIPVFLLSFTLRPAVFAATPHTATAGHALTGHVSDAQLEATIKTKLAKSKIGKDGFTFHVARGTVTWEGTTQVPQHKGAATRMAHSSGAAQVVNNIHVTGAKPGTPLKKAYVQ